MSIYVRIKHRFGPRLSEWFVATVMLLWGLVLLLPSDSLVGPSWVTLRALLPESGWGLLMALLGLARLGGLVVNGARKTVTPWIRVVSAGCGFLLWSGVSFALGFSSVVSTGLAVYPAIAVLELFNIHRASHDIGETHHASAAAAGRH